MESKASRTCAICRQIKLAAHFPKTARGGHLLAQANICLTCRAASLANLDDEDEGGSGGLQLQLQKNAKQLQLAMEQDAALQKELEELNSLTHDKDNLGMSQRIENERKKQASQRELLDLKEDISKITQNGDEPNPDLALDTQARREKITRLFSVTRSLARNYVAANNAKAIAQKNFGIFSHTKEEKIATKIENTQQANIEKALSKESSTLFSQPHPAKEPATSEAEKLANAIREGQKIFSR